jgi:hypothetical protein
MSDELGRQINRAHEIAHKLLAEEEVDAAIVIATGVLGMILKDGVKEPRAITNIIDMLPEQIRAFPLFNKRN